MKKILALILALTLAMSLAACGGGNSDSQPSGGQTSGGDAQPSDDLPGAGQKIALVCDKVGNQVFLTQMVDALNEAAEK